MACSCATAAPVQVCGDTQLRLDDPLVRVHAVAQLLLGEQLGHQVLGPSEGLVELLHPGVEVGDVAAVLGVCFL
jgi:hypothetical protein